MRLLALHLIRYGNFAADHIVFDPRPGCVNVLLAPNGAGKSVLRQAFSDLLFGIAGQTPMGFRFGYSGMRISAQAVTPDGTTITFGRRKGLGNTLLDARGSPDESGALARLLGQTDRTQFERLFALDTERLRAGGEQLLTTGGSVADALLAAGGLRSAKELRQSLDAAADALAPARRVAQKPFYLALDGLQDARKRAGSALLRPDDWVRMESDLADVEAQRTEQNRLAATQATHMARLQRVRRVRAPMAERDAADAWLIAHLEAPVLSPSLEPKLAEASARLVVAEEQLEREGQRGAELAGERAAITVDQALLASADTIDRLSEQAGAVGKALTDIPNRAAEHSAVHSRIATVMQRLGSVLPAHRAAELVPGRAAESRARTLIAQHSAVAAALEQAPTAIAAAQADIAEKNAALAKLPPPDDIHVLAPLVAEVRAGGDPAAREEEVTGDLEESRAALAAALARVPAWSGSAQSLIGILLLPTASYDRLDAARRDADAEKTRRMDRAKYASDQQTQAVRRLADITGGGPVPNEMTIGKARLHRNRGWQLIYRLAFTDDGPSPAEQHDFAGEHPLPLAYEQAVQAADGLADRRTLEADFIARAAAAQRAFADAEVDAREAAAAVTSAEQAAVTAGQAWAEACVPLPFGIAASIEDVRSFLAAREHVIEHRKAVDRHAQAVERLATRHAEWAARLHEALTSSPLSALSLPALLALAEDRLAAAARTTQQRIGLEAGLRELQRRLEGADAAQREAERKHATWQADWEAVLNQLGRPADESPDVAADILALLTELDQDQKAATRLDDRLRAMRADNSVFTDAVAMLCDQAAPDLGPDRAAGDATTTDMLAALRTLRERLQDHRARAARSAELQRMLDQADRQIGQLEERVKQRQTECQAVLASCGAATVEDAEQRLAASRERANHITTIARAEATLREDGDALSIELLRAELAAHPAEDVPGALTVADATMGAANTAAQDAAARASSQRLLMDQRSDDRAYVAAIADQQSAIATLGRVLEEAMLARLAGALLGHAMEAVEAQNSSALLARISQYFRTVTDGAYDRVVTEDDGDGGLALAMIPHDLPHEQKLVDQLSEGTRDQLYLALRLAAIEDHVATAPPVPFIGDDILQTSDDTRAHAALRALLDLSHRVQVIVLTHHPHILQLAQSLPEGAVHVCEVSSDLPVAV